MSDWLQSAGPVLKCSIRFGRTFPMLRPEEIEKDIANAIDALRIANAEGRS
jgi:hypothetical protein